MREYGLVGFWYNSLLHSLVYGLGHDRRKAWESMFELDVARPLNGSSIQKEFWLSFESGAGGYFSRWEWKRK
jgi:hypothetical protein